VLFKSGKKKELPLKMKSEIAHDIVHLILANRNA